ncbi:IstB-like ATP binding protein [Oceanospirillum multiglobuliferum]|uniref:HTH luxR-type domain-containing protein n=2 Tax=Oceanospirillum TaxID=965 RepID=A0A1T4QWG5_9GAMM|nr:LuxR C-terminal-related transcriptional regulator [Oceanospirillum multiglobuliferum]OPX57086.1 hypothetical protein BTE48_01260 [Oceanospirillum multiglobuliferum]SKA08120.1 IstB-like ATP binding protein [Oceanospirillum multiglobuliferum]
MSQGEAKISISGSTLTKRQLEILLLIKDGKTNKEIASSLDINLGTVKQHIAVLFKKLDIHNRSMAVAIADKFIVNKKRDIFSIRSPYLFARRPAVVVSLKFGFSSAKIRRKINTVLSDIAFDFHGHHVNHSPYSADIVFGLKRSSEQDIIAALIAINKVHNLFLELGLASAQDDYYLSAAIAVGFILVSQHRYGGWSGETVAGPVIAEAHKLLVGVEPNSVCLSQETREMLLSFDIDLHKKTTCSFEQVSESLCWQRQINLPLIGRNDLVKRLINSFSSSPICIGIFGESGMGKSRLCRELAFLLSEKNFIVEYFKIVPSGCLDMVRGRYIEFFSRVSRVLSTVKSSNRVIIIDDIHLLPDDERSIFLEIVKNLVQTERVLISGRYAIEPILKIITTPVRLSRLDDNDAFDLISKLGVTYDAKSKVFNLSRNIPLFIKELSKNEDKISIALMTVVASRLDMFNLDWKLLYLLSKSSGKACSEILAIDEDFYESLDAAINAGVLVDDNGYIRYKNPLVEKVIESFFLVESGD